MWHVTRRALGFYNLVGQRIRVTTLPGAVIIWHCLIVALRVRLRRRNDDESRDSRNSRPVLF